MSTESFIPPIHNYPLMWFMDNALKVLMKGVNNVDEVVISELDSFIFPIIQLLKNLPFPI